MKYKLWKYQPSDSIMKDQYLMHIIQSLSAFSIIDVIIIILLVIRVTLSIVYKLKFIILSNSDNNSWVSTNVRNGY